MNIYVRLYHKIPKHWQLTITISVRRTVFRQISPNKYQMHVLNEHEQMLEKGIVGLSYASVSLKEKS